VKEGLFEVKIKKRGAIPLGGGEVQFNCPSSIFLYFLYFNNVSSCTAAQSYQFN
jgi:RNA 3'-terminal phosphate cyclase